MSSNGPPVPFAIISIALVGLLLSGVIFFCIRKFYHILLEINENLVGIRRAVESASLLRL